MIKINIHTPPHRYAPAVEVLDHALSVQPFNFQALHNRAVLAMDLGEWSMAAELSERASELKDDDACWHTLCLASLQLGQYERGWRLYDTRHKLFHRDIPPFRNMRGARGR